MKFPGIAIACALSALVPGAISAQSASPQSASGVSLIQIREVDRDGVPAGTPAAFTAAFPNAQRNEAAKQVGEERYTFVPLAFVPLSDTLVALVSTGSNDCTGQACSGLNAVHYLSHEPGKPRYPFEVKGEWLDVGAVGVVGNPALRWGWTDRIADAPVLYTEAGGTWQGRSCSYAVLTALTPSGPVQIARIPTAFSDASTEGGEAGMDGTITAAEKGTSFTVSYGGSRSFTETYRRGADGRFRLKGKSRVPSC